VNIALTCFGRYVRWLPGTPLHWACGSSNEVTVTALLDNKADPNARDKDSVTPLIIATATGSAAIVGVRQRFGIVQTVDGNGSYLTPWHYLDC